MPPEDEAWNDMATMALTPRHESKLPYLINYTTEE